MFLIAVFIYGMIAVFFVPFTDTASDFDPNSPVRLEFVGLMTKLGSDIQGLQRLTNVSLGDKIIQYMALNTQYMIDSFVVLTKTFNMTISLGRSASVSSPTKIDRNIGGLKQKAAEVPIEDQVNTTMAEQLGEVTASLLDANLASSPLTLSEQINKFINTCAAYVRKGVSHLDTFNTLPIITSNLPAVG